MTYYTTMTEFEYVCLIISWTFKDAQNLVVILDTHYFVTTILKHCLNRTPAQIMITYKKDRYFSLSKFLQI